MRSCFLRLFALGLVGLVTAAVAQTNTAAPAVLPDGFNFAGQWDCVGAMGNGRVHKASFTGAVVLGGKWLELTEADVEPATGYVAKYLIGYDSRQKRLVEFDANNFGAAVYGSDAGWRNRVLTMASAVDQDAKAPYAANRFVYSITGVDDFTVDWQVSKSADLKWLPGDHLACRRKAGV